MVLLRIVGDAVEQMSFSQTDAAVDEEGIVRFAGSCGDAEGG